MMDVIFVFLASGLLFFLSFANGGNDVSKAIATLAGAKLTSVRGAVLWGTAWTVAGALSGLFWGQEMVKNISQSVYTQQHDFYLPLALASVLAPALWVSLATWRKWPVSTTHAVVGGLIGVGLIAFGIDGVNWTTLWSKIALPLLASPFMAIALVFVLTPFLKKLAHAISGTRVCISPVPRLVYARANGTTEPIEGCAVCDIDSIQAKTTLGFTLSLDHLHWLTSGLLSFSRGLNDTPKLIAIALPFLLLDTNIPPYWMYFLAATAMGAGSIIAGRRVTEVLGFKITAMNHAEGFSANLISTALVMSASRLGLPVSTTHVSASSIMGVGLSRGHGLNRQTIVSMLFAWLITVPISGIFAILIYIIGKSF